MLLCTAWASIVMAGTGTSVGVGITINRHAAATANNGQVDINTRLQKSVAGTLSATPVFGGQHLTYSVVAQPAHGTLSITNASTGAFTYTARGIYDKDVDSFTFRVADDFGVTSNTATEYVVQNLKPTANAGSAVGLHGIPLNGTLSATPSYSGELLTFVIVSQGFKGTIVITDVHTGAFTYTRASSQTGTDYFKFKVTDSQGLASNIALESMTLN